MIFSILNKIPNAHPLIVGGFGAISVEAVHYLPEPTTISSIVQIIIGIVTILKMIFPNKQKKNN